MVQPLKMSSKVKVPYTIKERRPGDVTYYAIDKANIILGWKARKLSRYDAILGDGKVKSNGYES